MRTSLSRLPKIASNADDRAAFASETKRDVSAPPRDLAELSHRLNRCALWEAEGLAAVAKFAIDHPYDVAFGTARSIADRCGVSTTPVIRLASGLGFEGFHQMREFFRGPLRDFPSPPG